MKRAGVVLILLLAFCGIAVSAYLTQHEVSGAALICNVEGLSGCNTVVGSEYSRLWGLIPLAPLGLLFYTILFVLAAFEIVLFNQLLRRILQLLAIFGILFSLYSVYTQMVLIKAYCIYCLTSVLITILVLLFASLIEPVWPKKLRVQLTTTSL